MKEVAKDIKASRKGMSTQSSRIDEKFENILEHFRKDGSDTDLEPLKTAFKIAREAHKKPGPQIRRTVYHPSPGGCGDS